MTRKIQVAVIGSSAEICTRKMYQTAYDAGKHLAEHGITVITGGGLGVMEAALKGAKDAGGTTLAIVPWETPNMVNEYADIVVATGIGWSRNAINLNSCDGAIVVGGGAGTLNEATYAYIQSRPVVAITTSGGIAKHIAGKFLDMRRSERVHQAKSAKHAVDILIHEIKKTRKSISRLSQLDQELLDTEEKADWATILRRKKLKKDKNKVL